MILIAWTVVVLLVYVRTMTYAELLNNPIESIIACVASKSNTTIYVGSLVASHAVVLGSDIYVSVAEREISQEFQESIWIEMAID